MAVTVYLKETMHDPDSYEHVATTEPAARGAAWVVQSSFRGKNMFGAKILTTKTFYIQSERVVKVEDVAE